jgi:predicted O-methyltransferase YrrM
MSTRTLELTETIHRYLLEVSLRESPLMRRLREETGRMPNAQMQISPEQGQFMALLVELTGARRALEIGAFTGYSALCVAGALPEDGRLICCDVSEEWTAIARRYWSEAGLSGKIDLRLAPALETLDALLDQGSAGSFDFAFIDADKTSYDAYYERVLRLLRPGGLVAFDNVLWGGRLADPDHHSPDAQALRALNLKVRDDPRVTCSMVPIGDGLYLARKRA